jgi:hypothetical protein
MMYDNPSVIRLNPGLLVDVITLAPAPAAP